MPSWRPVCRRGALHEVNEVETTVSGVLQVQTTVNDRGVAASIARMLVDECLAACVQVLGPIESTYRWEHGIEVATEWLLLAKTTADAWPALATRLAALHPYREPELIALPVVHASEGYAGWLRSEVAPR